MRATLPDFGLIDATPLQTTPPTYLHQNHPPETHPTLLFDPPLETPAKPPAPTREDDTVQFTIGYYIDNVCQVCLCETTNVSEHLLVDHADVVNEHLAAITTDRDPTPEPKPDPGPDPEPTLFKATPDARPGQRVDGFTDHRACNDCGDRLSAGYAKIFATETGDLYCPDCRSRAERYSNESGTFGGTSPDTVTGSANPNSAANDDPAWAEPTSQ